MKLWSFMSLLFLPISCFAYDISTHILRFKDNDVPVILIGDRHIAGERGKVSFATFKKHIEEWESKKIPVSFLVEHNLEFGPAADAQNDTLRELINFLRDQNPKMSSVETIFSDKRKTGTWWIIDYFTDWYKAEHFINFNLPDKIWEIDEKYCNKPELYTALIEHWLLFNKGKLSNKFEIIKELTDIVVQFEKDKKNISSLKAQEIVKVKITDLKAKLNKNAQMLIKNNGKELPEILQQLWEKYKNKDYPLSRIRCKFVPLFQLECEIADVGFFTEIMKQKDKLQPIILFAGNKHIQNICEMFKKLEENNEVEFLISKQYEEDDSENILEQALSMVELFHQELVN